MANTFKEMAITIPMRSFYFLSGLSFVNNMESRIISTRPKSFAIDLEEYTWRTFHHHTILFFIYHLDVLLVP
jgi:hypothetical protein